MKLKKLALAMATTSLVLAGVSTVFADTTTSAGSDISKNLVVTLTLTGIMEISDIPPIVNTFDALALASEMDNDRFVGSSEFCVFSNLNSSVELQVNSSNEDNDYSGVFELQDLAHQWGIKYRLDLSGIGTVDVASGLGIVNGGSYYSHQITSTGNERNLIGAGPCSAGAPNDIQAKVYAVQTTDATPAGIYTDTITMTFKQM